MLTSEFAIVPLQVYQKTEEVKVDGAKLFEQMRAEQMRNNQKLLNALNISVSDSDEDEDGFSGDSTEMLGESDDGLRSSSGSNDRERRQLSRSNHVEPPAGSNAANTNAPQTTELCMVCLDRVKPEHPIWQCPTCYCFKFHLHCIKAWVKEADAKANLKELLPGLHNPKKNKDKTWHCPNCRTEYLVADAPKDYVCFCGKTRDPEPNPWITPHSVRSIRAVFTVAFDFKRYSPACLTSSLLQCGELCEKPYRPRCGHSCTEQCHPGKCPPCPQQLRTSCFCGAVTQMVRALLSLLSSIISPRQLNYATCFDRGDVLTSSTPAVAFVVECLNAETMLVKTHVTMDYVPHAPRPVCSHAAADASSRSAPVRSPCFSVSKSATNHLRVVTTHVLPCVIPVSVHHAPGHCREHASVARRYRNYHVRRTSRHAAVLAVSFSHVVSTTVRIDATPVSAPNAPCL
jgi:hypothetical protein